MDTGKHLRALISCLAVLTSLLVFQTGCVPGVEDQPYFEVGFQGSKGWIIGPSSFRSTDGGRTWEPWFQVSYYNPDYEPLGLAPRLQMLDDAVGFWAKDGRLHRTSDGGATWRLVNGEQAVRGIWFRDPFLGFADVPGFGLIKTTDGGKNWSPVQVHCWDCLIQFDEAGSAYASVGRKLLLSQDGGETFSRLLTELSSAVWGMERHGDHLWLVGDTGLCVKYSLSDGVVEDFSLPEPVELHDIAIDNRYKVAVGRSGSVFVSPLESHEWSSYRIGDGIVLASVAFAPDGTAFVVGGAELPVLPAWSPTAPSARAAKSNDMRNWSSVPLQ